MEMGEKGGIVESAYDTRNFFCCLIIIKRNITVEGREKVDEIEIPLLPDIS